MFHYVKGTPYKTMDQGESSWMTNWEQIDDGKQFTPTRNFLLSFMIILLVWKTTYIIYTDNFYFRFIIVSFFTIHDSTLTIINIVVLLIGVVPKLDFLHGFRIEKLLYNDKANQ